MSNPSTQNDLITRAKNFEKRLADLNTSIDHARTQWQSLQDARDRAVSDLADLVAEIGADAAVAAGLVPPVVNVAGAESQNLCTYPYLTPHQIGTRICPFCNPL